MQDISHRTKWSDYYLKRKHCANDGCKFPDANDLVVYNEVKAMFRKSLGDKELAMYEMISKSIQRADKLYWNLLLILTEDFKFIDLATFLERAPGDINTRCNTTYTLIVYNLSRQSVDMLNDHYLSLNLEFIRKFLLDENIVSINLSFEKLRLLKRHLTVDEWIACVKKIKDYKSVVDLASETTDAKLLTAYEDYLLTKVDLMVAAAIKNKDLDDVEIRKDRIPDGFIRLAFAIFDKLRDFQEERKE